MSGLEDLYEDEFDGFIEFENQDEKMNLLREERALLEEYDDEEFRRAKPAKKKKKPVAKASSEKVNAVKKITRKKTTGKDEDEGPKLPLKYRRIEKYTNQQMGFHVLHQALHENKEFMELSTASTSDKESEKLNLMKRLNIYLDTLHDWCKTIFPDLSFDEALAFMESQSFNNKVHKAMDWGRSTFSSRYQKAVEAKEQRKRKRKKGGKSATSEEGGNEDEQLDDNEDEVEDNQNETNQEAEQDEPKSDKKASPYKPKPISVDEGEEEFQFDDTTNNEEAEGSDEEEEPTPKKKKTTHTESDEESNESSLDKSIPLSQSLVPSTTEDEQVELSQNL